MKCDKICYFLFIYINSCAVFVVSKYCYWNAGCSYKYFSSITPYGSIRGDLRDSVLKVKGCEPISIWSIYRHGQRYPSEDIGNKIKEAITLRDDIVSSFDNGKSSLCAQDVENLRNWVRDDTMFEKAHFLTDEGYAELHGIGKRLKETYPNFLSNLDEDSYIIRSAVGHWIENSAKGFVEGLVGNRAKIKIDNPNEKYDFIAPYSNCKKYQEEIKYNSSTYHEIEIYKKSMEFMTATDRIQRRLGIKTALTNELIISLYNMCGYSWSGISVKPTPWCALFSTDDLSVLEYIGDLRNYYNNGYGSPINSKFGGAPLEDLYKQFELAKNGEGRKLFAYFTHATMLDMIYVALGFFEDDFILKGTCRVRERKWRTSTHTTYASNLIAVLNRCNKENVTNEDYVLTFYLNEKRLKVCPEGWCTWDEFESKFKEFLNTTIDFCEDFIEPN